MKPVRVATLSLIAGLALADVAGAVYLSILWQQLHPPGGDAQVDARHGTALLKGASQQRRGTVGASP